jgi:hypothetical protein
VGCSPSSAKGLEVSGGAGRYGVVNTHYAFLRYEDGVGAQGLVADGAALKVGEAEDAAGKDRPQLALREPSLLQTAFEDLLLEGAFSELE